MAKYKYLITPIVLILLAIFVWRTSTLFTNLAEMLSGEATSPDAEQSTKTNRFDETIGLNKLPHNTGRRDAGHVDNLQATVARLQRDVVVTGTITGVPGQESAMFQIEGMADRHFNIDTQLMDGFIIQEITTSIVVLKNQSGDETISFEVQRGKGGSDDFRQGDGINDAYSDLPPISEATLGIPLANPDMTGQTPSPVAGKDSVNVAGDSVGESRTFRVGVENLDVAGEEASAQQEEENTTATAVVSPDSGTVAGQTEDPDATGDVPALQNGMENMSDQQSTNPDTTGVTN